MNILKQKIQYIYSLLKKSIQEFPVTITAIMLISIIVVLDLEIFEDYISHILTFGFVFIDGTFLIETLFREKKYNEKILFYIGSAILAGIFVYITENYKLFSSQMLTIIYKLYTCYLITLFTLAVYWNFKKCGKSFEEYMTNLFSNMFKTSIIYGILAIGVAIVTSIFISLILDGEGYFLLGKLEILILGFYYFPTLVYSFRNEEEGKSKFLRVIIKYVLGILLISAFVIIYMYIIKIIINKDMPSNQIFRILAALFILGMPIWTMIQSFKEEKTIDKISNALPALFIPFIILQIYSIGIRIYNNGITISRYLCIMLIIFEIFYTFIYLKKRENIAQIFKVFIVLTYISVIIPFVNMISVSNWSQYNNLKIFVEKSEYTDDDERKISGAYFYLKNDIDGEKLLSKLQLSKEDKKQIENMKYEYNKYDYNYSTKKYIRQSTKISELDTKEYKKVYFVDIREYFYSNENKKKINDIFSNFELKIDGIDKSINVDIYNEVSEYIKQYNDYYTSSNIYSNYNSTKDYFEKNNKIQLEKNKVLVLEEFAVDYDEITEEVESYGLKGYLLTKNDIN